MKNLLNFLSILFVTFFVIGCGPDDSDFIDPKSKVNYLSAAEIPDLLKKLNERIGFTDDPQFSANSGSSPVGTIRFDEIIQVLDELDNANYTFRVEDEDNNPFTFTNLIVRESVEGHISAPYLLHYEMDTDFIPHYMANGSLLDFSGKIYREYVDVESAESAGLSANLNVTYGIDDSDCPPLSMNSGISDGRLDNSDGLDPQFGDEYESCYAVIVGYEVHSDYGSTSTAKYRPGPGIQFTPIIEWVCPSLQADNGINDGSDCPNLDGDLAILGDDDRVWALLLDLERELVNNPHLLVEIPCTEIQKWLELARHLPPSSVIDKLRDIQNRNPRWPGFPEKFDLQILEDGLGQTVNMDYFSVTVTELPDGKTAGQLLDLIRRNINAFVDTDLSEFKPYSLADTGDDENVLWNSSNPLGAIIHIDIPGDDGAVIVSDYSTSDWKFTTLTAPGIWIHPVSGTRQFGYTKNLDGSYTFFTRGTDRITMSISEFVSVSMEGVRLDELADKLGQEIAFNSADALWTSFQTSIEEHVNRNGGFAFKNDPVIFRPDWQKLEDVLLRRADISSLDCD